jgi:aryl-alcohol dehydrogenase-like predicted oxidoreductase
MRYACITNTDLKPSVICLGTHEFGSGVSQEDAFALMDAYLDAGGCFIDTADQYADWQCDTPGMSELTIGKWMKSRSSRDKLVLATKGGSQSHIWPFPRLSRDELEVNLELSLTRLGVDYVDLFYLHVDDPARPVEEILDTMEYFRQKGWLRWYASSNWTAPRLRAADAYALKQGYAGFVASQIHWSLADVDSENDPDIPHIVMKDDIYQYHLESGVTQCPYTPQASGFFSGNYIRNNPDSGKPGVYNSYNLERNWGRLERAQKMAQELGCSANQIALAYLIAQPFPVFPIVGSWKMHQLLDSLGAGDLVLTPEQVRYLRDGNA